MFWNQKTAQNWNRKIQLTPRATRLTRNQPCKDGMYNIFATLHGHVKLATAAGIEPATLGFGGPAASLGT
jgi:hypothetical protein